MYFLIDLCHKNQTLRYLLGHEMCQCSSSQSHKILYLAMCKTCLLVVLCHYIGKYNEEECRHHFACYVYDSNVKIKHVCF